MRGRASSSARRRRPIPKPLSLTTADRVLTVTGNDYRLELPHTELGIAKSPYATLSSSDGTGWTDICLLSSVHTVSARDEIWAVGAPRVEHESPTAITVVVPVSSTAWESHELHLRCTPTTVELHVTVRGDGRLGDVVLFGGSGRLRSGASGDFRSSVEFPSVFAPAPGEPVSFVRPSHASAVLGVVGDSGPGRLSAIFSPPPLVLGLGRSEAAGATDVPDGDWLGLGLRAAVGDLTFTTMRYEPVDGGFSIRLSYEGHTEVDGEWSSPALVLRASDSGFGVLEDYRADLEQHGYAPAPPSEPADWWLEPIFCGWGAQCARLAHRLHGALEPGAATTPESDEEETTVVTLAPQLARQTVYDEFLDRLGAHGLTPGTIVLDDRWQEEYGTATPDLEHWPDLAAWIAERHRAGQKVLLWWKAWDPSGLPADECITDAGGAPVAVDPANPRYLARLRDIVTTLLSPDGLDADGFKIDFTQRAPSGETLSGAAGPWGIAALHELLATISTAAKAAKPDALVICHTVHPSFGDVCDMVRLNDVSKYDTSHRRVPVVDQLILRHAIASRALPEHPIDTDQWPMPNRAEWRRYVAEQGRLGVPALYYVEAIDRSGESLSAEDLVAVAETWADYRSALESDEFAAEVRA